MDVPNENAANPSTSFLGRTAFTTPKSSRTRDWPVKVPPDAPKRSRYYKLTTMPARKNLQGRPVPTAPKVNTVLSSASNKRSLNAFPKKANKSHPMVANNGKRKRMLPLDLWRNEVATYDRNNNFLKVREATSAPFIVSIPNNLKDTPTVPKKKVRVNAKSRVKRSKQKPNCLQSLSQDKYNKPEDLFKCRENVRWKNCRNTLGKLCFRYSVALEPTLITSCLLEIMPRYETPLLSTKGFSITFNISVGEILVKILGVAEQRLTPHSSVIIPEGKSYILKNMSKEDARATMFYNTCSTEKERKEIKVFPEKDDRFL